MKKLIFEALSGLTNAIATVVGRIFVFVKKALRPATDPNRLSFESLLEMLPDGVAAGTHLTLNGACRCYAEKAPNIHSMGKPYAVESHYAWEGVSRTAYVVWDDASRTLTRIVIFNGRVREKEIYRFGLGRLKMSKTEVNHMGRYIECTDYHDGSVKCFPYTFAQFAADMKDYGVGNHLRSYRRLRKDWEQVARPVVHSAV